MKKFLSILGALSLTASSVSIVVACGNQNNENPPGKFNYEQLFDYSSQQAKIAMISEQFGLDPEAVAKAALSTNTLDYGKDLMSDDLFKELNLDGKIGAEGGIYNEFIPADFDLKALLPPDFDLSMIEGVIKGLPGEPIDIRTILEKTGPAQIAGLVGLIGKASSIVELFQGLGPLIATIGGTLGALQITDAISEAVVGVKDQVTAFIETGLSKETIQPVLHAISIGSNLERFQDLNGTAGFTINHLYSTFIISIVEAVKYATIPDYAGVDLVQLLDTTETGIGNVLSNSANDLYEIIKLDENGNSKISQFNMMNNFPKIIENFITSMNSLNVVLAAFRTPEVDFTKDKDADGNPIDHSQHLFSDSEINNYFVYDFYSTKIKDLNINLSGYNPGEAIANLQYYLNGNRYNFQKLIYVLAYSGGSLSPLLQFGLEIGAKFIPELAQLSIILPGYIIGPLVNDEELNLTKLINLNVFGSYPILDAINNMQPGLGDHLRDEVFPWIDEYFGAHQFETLFNGDLTPVIEKVLPLFGGEEIKTVVNKYIKDIFGNNKVNIDTIINKTPLASYLNLLNIWKVNNNLNVPHSYSYYVDKSLSQLAAELGKTFKIDLKASSADLKKYNTDYSYLEKLTNTLLYGTQEGTQGVLLQILDAIIAKDMSKVLDLIGFDATRQNVKVESVLGYFLKFIISDLTPDDKNPEIYKLATIKGHNNLTWVLDALAEFNKHLSAAEDISKFVNNLLNNSEAFVMSPKTDKENISGEAYFDNSKDLKSFVVEFSFDPSKISFEDGSKLVGEKTTYRYTLARTKATDKFAFIKN